MLGRRLCSVDGLRAAVSILPRYPIKHTSTAAERRRVIQVSCQCHVVSHHHTPIILSPLSARGLVLQPVRVYSNKSHSRNHPHPPKHTHDLYSILGVSPKATQQQIKDQFYNLSMLYHPDRNQGSHSAHQRFTEITEAYSILGQHTLRRKYDKGLLHDYPRKPHHDSSHYRDTHHQEGAKMAASTHTPKEMYNFDEFYRAHYGEALRWQREQEVSRKAAVAEAARLKALSEPMHRLLLVSVVVSVFIVGWMGSKYKEQKERQGK